MSERAEAFMDKWLDENVDAKQLRQPENIVARGSPNVPWQTPEKLGSQPKKLSKP